MVVGDPPSRAYDTVLLPQNYFWMWPIGVFLTTAVAGGVYDGPPTASGRNCNASGDCVREHAVLALVAIQPSTPSRLLAATAFESGVGERLLDQLRSNLVSSPTKGRS